jgi:hypothetical protein
MARSNARAGPSQPSQTQRTRAGRVRIEDVVPEEQDEEENSDNEDEEEEVVMDVDEEAGSVRIVVCLWIKKKKVYLNIGGIVGAQS